MLRMNNLKQYQLDQASSISPALALFAVVKANNSCFFSFLPPAAYTRELLLQLVSIFASTMYYVLYIPLELIF